MSTAATYRKTKQGEWVVFAPAALLQPGGALTVHTKDGKAKLETITRVGREFTVDGVAMAYGYLAPRQTQAQPQRGSRGPSQRHACVTGGDCSSFGRGQSCGGYDCDGW